MAGKKNKKEQKETFGLIGSVTGGVTGSILKSPLSFITDTLGLGNIEDYIKYIIIIFIIIIAIYIVFKMKRMGGSSNNYQSYPQSMYRY